jgi:hypothetical protein
VYAGRNLDSAGERDAPGFSGEPRPRQSFFSIGRSIGGWRRSTPTFPLNATPMMPFATVAARSKRSRCEKRSKRGWRRANWNCIRKRRRSCTARTTTVAAVSGAAVKAMRLTMRRWKLHHRNDLTLDAVAAWVRPVVTGWINYYGRFQRSALIPVFRPLDSFLKRWARRKYQRFKSARKRTHQWLKRVRSQQFWLFPHWALEARLNTGSRMNGDIHVGSRRGWGCDCSALLDYLSNL